MTELDEQIAGLRALADFLEAHPSLASTWERVRYTQIADTAAEFGELCAEIGAGTKGEIGHINQLTFTKDFGGGVTLELWVSKELTCEKRVVGQRTVTRKVPAVDVEMVEVTETEDVIEWVCPPSFLGIGADAIAAHPAGKGGR